MIESNFKKNISKKYSKSNININSIYLFKFKNYFLNLTRLQFTTELEDTFWGEVVANNYINDLTCDKTNGPSWCLLKALQTICCLKSDDKKRKKSSSISETKTIFTYFLKEYKNNLEESQSKAKSTLKNLKDFNYHNEMILKCIQSYLDVVNFNLNLTNDNNLWLDLF
jgi:hypothetical protein